MTEAASPASNAVLMTTHEAIAAANEEYTHQRLSLPPIVVPSAVATVASDVRTPSPTRPKQDRKMLPQISTPEHAAAMNAVEYHHLVETPPLTQRNHHLQQQQQPQ